MEVACNRKVGSHSPHIPTKLSLSLPPPLSSRLESLSNVFWGVDDSKSRAYPSTELKEKCHLSFLWSRRPTLSYPTQET